MDLEFKSQLKNKIKSKKSLIRKLRRLYKIIEKECKRHEKRKHRNKICDLLTIFQLIIYVLIDEVNENNAKDAMLMIKSHNIRPHDIKKCFKGKKCKKMKKKSYNLLTNIIQELEECTGIKLFPAVELEDELQNKAEDEKTLESDRLDKDIKEEIEVDYNMEKYNNKQFNVVKVKDEIIENNKDTQHIISNIKNNKKSANCYNDLDDDCDSVYDDELSW